MNLKQVARALVLMPVAAVLLSAPRQAQAAPEPEGPRLALVVGNASYAALPALPACAASAHVVAAALKRVGFDTIERLDRTNGEMGADLAAFVSMATKQPGARTVVYVCGYAIGFNNRAFLLPVSATIQRDTDVLTQGLVAKSVLAAVEQSRAVAGLVLFDAITKPPGTAKPSFETLASEQAQGGIALAAAETATTPPQGATPLAAAFSAALTTNDIEAGAVVQALQQRLGGAAGTQLTILAPAEPVWLVGGPAPVAVAPSAPDLSASRSKPVSIPQSPSPEDSPQAPPSIPTASAATPAPPAAVVFPDEEHMTDADRRRIQAALLRLGYYDSQVDGIFGPDTQAAIRRFQHEIGADMTGHITPGQANRLLAGNH